MSELVLAEKRGPVAWLTLNQPEIHNALSTAMNIRLVETLRDVDADPGVSVVVLRGAGDKAFCAGADLREVVDKTVLQYRDEFARIYETFETMAATRKPIIAAVQGYALGGGCGLVAACDLAVAADTAVFGTPELRIGRFPLIIAAPILRTVGRKKAMEMLFTARRFSASEALEMGLVNRVVPRERLWHEVEQLANEIASASPAILALGKEALTTMTGMEYSASMRYLREILSVVALTEDSQEGVHAFLEKRAPQWKGR